MVWRLKTAPPATELRSIGVTGVGELQETKGTYRVSKKVESRQANMTHGLVR